MNSEQAVILAAAIAGIANAIDAARARKIGLLLAIQRGLGALVYLGIAWTWTLRELGQPWPDVAGGPPTIMRTILIALAFLGTAEVVTRWRRSPESLCPPKAQSK